MLFVDERNGVLGLEKVEGWSIREVLGGGAEGEEEGQGEEGEYIDPKEAREVVKELEEVVSEGMEALCRIGVTKGAYFDDCRHWHELMNRSCVLG